MGILDKILGRGSDLELRKPRFAGMLYAATKAELAEQVDALMAGVEPQAALPRALIVPHADFAVVGPVMAAGWASVAVGDAFERVALIGSSRLVPFRGLAITGADGFETPLGPLLSDRSALEELVSLEQVRQIEAAFDPEASLETQLPFVRRVLGEVRVVPILVGDAADEDVEAVIARFLDDPATLVVVSANLSADVSAERADVLDAETARAIESLEPERIGREHSPGRAPIRGLLRAATARNWHAHTIARARSDQLTGEPADTVSGFGVFSLVGSG